MPNEEVTLRKLEILCSFIRTGNLTKTARRDTDEHERDYLAGAESP